MYSKFNEVLGKERISLNDRILFKYIFVEGIYLNMKKFFTTLLFLLILIFTLFAQHKATRKPAAKKTYIKKPASQLTVQKTTNQPAPAMYRNAEEPLNFNGQWKGSFVDNTASFMGFGGEKVDYVLELESRATEITGYSYTYFTENGKHYYTICKLRGTINRTTKEIVVTEFERTKFNTPPDVSNCFQTHRLKYIKQNDEDEALQGSWIPAPNQDGNCGYGRTVLSRKIIKKTPLIVPKQTVALPKKDDRFRDMNRQPQKPVITQTKPPVKNTATIKPPLKKPNSANNNIVTKVSPPQLKIDTVKRQSVIVNPPAKKDNPVISSNLKFENRVNSVLKTIPLKAETFTVDFYDNGEIDGDSISVFFNGKLVLSHKLLTDKPLTLKLNFDTDKPINELVMYAESLGSIPPNTALMIVHDGDDRYEARIESDLGRNGTIRFTHKAKQVP